MMSVRRKVNFVCDYCGKPSYGWYNKKSHHHFCSHECWMNALREGMLKSTKKKEVKKAVCVRCHKEFTVPKDYDPNRILWCSKCRSFLRRTTNDKF